MKKCLCARIMQNEFDPFHEKPLSKIYIHLMGCPESLEVKEYNALKWWQKIFKYNPLNYYYEHMKRTRTYD